MGFLRGPQLLFRAGETPEPQFLFRAGWKPAPQFLLACGSPLNKACGSPLHGFVVLGVVVLAMTGVAFAGPADPWADFIVDYQAGTGANPGYPNASTALGSPERFTGETLGFPGVVSVFNPAFGDDEIVSIGGGGSLTVRFNEPIRNDASHAFGVDLIVFGNAGFGDAAWPDGRAGTPAAMFGAGGAVVEVSSNGVDYVSVSGLADALFPTQGYVDAGHYDAAPGAVAADFLRPVNPAFTLSSFDGRTYSEILAMYDGSGGGTPIDIAPLDSVSFVRVSLPAGADVSAEIDAFAAVPEPGAGGMILVAGLIAGLRRRRGF